MPPRDMTRARPWLSLAETGGASKVRGEQEAMHRLIDLVASYLVSLKRLKKTTWYKNCFDLSHPTSINLIFVPSRNIDKPSEGCVSWATLRTGTWNLEALLPIKHCMGQTRTYKKRAYLLFDSKLTTFQHEIRIQTVYPGQGENWWRLSWRAHEKAVLTFPVRHPSRYIAKTQFPYVRKSGYTTAVVFSAMPRSILRVSILKALPRTCT